MRRVPRSPLIILCLLSALALVGGAAAEPSDDCPPAGVCVPTEPTTTSTTTTTTTTTSTTTDVTTTTDTTTTTTVPDTSSSNSGSSWVLVPPGSSQGSATDQQPQPGTAGTGVFPLGFGPQGTTPALGGGPYVFPVYGPVSFVDTFGAPRADVSWHHGDDIFAPLGSPVLAVADGTLISIGWNQIGGNRLWLRDRKGNYFYYAHLAAFATTAVDGAAVHAGDVVGFVGNTGDAAGTPFHLHFEIHPVGLLGLGYDGAVDPTTYLQRWQHAGDLGAASLGFGWSRHPAPPAGAVLLTTSDISSANGLEPGSLARAMTAGTGTSESVAVPVSAEPDGATDTRTRPIDAVRDFGGPLPEGMLAASPWDLVARCESSGRWNTNSGNGFFGGLQFEPGTWQAYGGTAYAPSAQLATREQQITIAERVLEGQGWLAWPACSTQLGLRGSP